MTPWRIWAAMSLVSWFLRISIVWFFSCQCIATHSDKPSSFCPGLGPAQGLCWFPVAEDGCSLTSCRRLVLSMHSYNSYLSPHRSLKATANRQTKTHSFATYQEKQI